MSHDITARSKKTGRKISSISIKAFNQFKSWILYESLDCSKYNAGVSGNGGSKTLLAQNLELAFLKFKYLSGEPEDKIKFEISLSKPFISASSILNDILISSGYEYIDSEIKIDFDEEALFDVERFLSGIIGSEEIIIDFM